MIRSMLGMISGCALLMAACGGDSDSGGQFSTSVDSGKKVSMLTAAEETQICKDFDTWGNDVEKSFTPKICKLVAIFSETKAECDKAYADCLKAPSEPSTGGDMCMTPKNCTATIGEVQKCINDTMNVIGSYFDRFPSCAQVADGSGSIPAGEPQQPASCKALATTCPDIANIGEDLGGTDEELDGNTDQ